MSNWQDWEMSTAWSNNSICPDCGHSLIITHLVLGNLIDDGDSTYNGICPHCHKQYTVSSNEALTINAVALEQQAKIDNLEERVKQLELIVQSLKEAIDTPRPSAPSTAPQPPEDTPPLLDKYSFLLG